MVLAAQNALFTGNKTAVEARNRTARISDYLIRLHYDPTPAVSNRLYAARYELGSYRASVYERLKPRPLYSFPSGQHCPQFEIARTVPTESVLSEYELEYLREIEIRPA
jgi:hypothetical protein